MEAAAKSVELLTQCNLPEEPHHLSFHEDWRYRPPPNEGKRLEEWSNPRLQYLTLVSEADRGLLLTRSDYDMREEPVRPPPREASELPKGNPEKKKLSLSDYKNKKTNATSASPPEPAIAKKREGERASTSASYVRKPDRPKPRDPDPPVEPPKQRQIREPVVDMRLPPKPPSKHPLPPRPPSPNMNRKRVADLDEELRPQKRYRSDGRPDGRPDSRPDARPDARPDGARSGEGRTQLDDVQRRKDRPPLPHSFNRNAPLHRDEKPSNPPPSTLTNGKPTLKTAAASLSDTVSHGARPRSDSMNGTRLNVTGNARSISIKHESTNKPSVPPLLSPLHLNFDENDDDHSQSKQDRKKRDDVRDKPRSPKHKKLEPPSANKRHKSPARIPPLLSPTLPPIVEAALQLRKKILLDSSDGKVKEEKESPSKKKKKKATMEYTDDDEPLQKSQRKTLIVTLKLPEGFRSHSKRFPNIFPPAARKETSSTRDQERSATDESLNPPQARKRPVASADSASETIALKKPRAPDSSTNSRQQAPSTPSKKGPAAMSRVSSSNSLAQTPGDAVNATPSTSVAVDRRHNGQGGSSTSEGPGAKAMREKEAKFHTLGRRLKHDADLMMKEERQTPGGSGKNREPNPKLGYVLSLESLLAFMAGFHAQNLHRTMSNKKCDPTGWATLFPFLEFLQKEIRRHEPSRRYLPLFSLLLLLHAAAVDELIKCYTALENPAAVVKFEDVLRLERTRIRVWPQIRDSNEMIDQPGLRIDLNPWATLDEITFSAIRILRRWCADEDVDWVPDPSLKEPVGSNRS